MDPEENQRTKNTPEVFVKPPLTIDDEPLTSLEPMKQLDSMLDDISEMETAISELKHRIREIPAILRKQITNVGDRTRIARYLYWTVPEIPPSIIRSELLDDDRKAGICPLLKSSLGIKCDSCQELLIFTSRTKLAELNRECREAHRKGYSFEVLCQQCRDERSQEHDAAWEKIRDEQRARELELQRMPYREYLLTPEWQERRKQQLRSAGYRCQVCNTNGTALNVHHRTYERRGCEYYKDLLVLCQSCHELFHSEGRLAES